MTHKLVINGRIKTLNEYISALNASKYKGAQLKRDEETKISAAIWQQLRGVRIEAPVFIVFNWHCKDKKFDKDNIAAAKKFCLDALVTCGTLKNDTWERIVGFSDNFYVDKNNPKVEIYIKEVENEL